jgi:hypothetical protein
MKVSEITLYLLIVIYFIVYNCVSHIVLYKSISSVNCTKRDILGEMRH